MFMDATSWLNLLFSHISLIACCMTFFFFIIIIIWMGTQNGHNVPFLASASLGKGKE